MAADEINAARHQRPEINSFTKTIRESHARPPPLWQKPHQSGSGTSFDRRGGVVKQHSRRAKRPESEGADDFAVIDESKSYQIGDYIFRVCFIDPFQGEVMAKFAFNSLKAKKAAILFDSNSTAQGLISSSSKPLLPSSGTIVIEKAYAQRDRDFTGQLTAIRIPPLM
jgi:hypothetical protein